MHMAYNAFAFGLVFFYCFHSSLILSLVLRQKNEAVLHLQYIPGGKGEKKRREKKKIKNVELNVLIV